MCLISEHHHSHGVVAVGGHPYTVVIAGAKVLAQRISSCQAAASRVKKAMVFYYQAGG